MSENLEEKLVEARRIRAARKLDGKAIDKDNAAIAALENEIQIQYEVEAEKANRAREAAQEAHEKERAVKRAQLEAMVSDDLQDMVEAEAGARQLAAAVSRMIKRNLQLTKTAVEIRLPIPAALGRFELERRIACLISAVMGSVSPNHRGRLGATTWFPGIHKPDTKWRDVAARLYETLLGRKEVTDGNKS